MNSVFKLLIGVIVAGIILYLVFTMFVFPKADPYAELSKSVKLALNDSGNPVCGKLDLVKNSNVSTKVLMNTNLLANESIFLWFASFNPKLNVFSSNELSNISTKTGEKQLDYCVICYPKIVFANILKTESNGICEIVFGKKLLPISTNLISLNSEEQQGIKNMSVVNNLPANYVHAVYVINNEKNQTISKNNLSYLNNTKDTNVENVIYLDSTNKTNNLELSKAGDKIILQVILQKNINLFSEPVLPMQFAVQNVNVIPNDDYQMATCKTTKQENQGKDFTLQKCLVYNYCEGCFLASHCAKAWQNEGVDSEAIAVSYSKSYLPFDQCD